MGGRLAAQSSRGVLHTEDPPLYRDLTRPHMYASSLDRLNFDVDCHSRRQVGPSFPLIGHTTGAHARTTLCSRELGPEVIVTKL